MTQTTISRSVLHTSTVDFKRHFREYLKDLAQDIDPDRVGLIEKLEWCFDRWEYWRQKFYPDADLMFPFFQSGRRGSEFGHYSTLGDSGQPSVIHIKRSYLMGTSDITVWKLSKTKKLVLRADHPDRLKYVDATILHELVHQYLHEASPDAADYERYESGRSNHKGHGKLFAAECNRINQVLHPELGFGFVPVRHVKRDRGTIADRKRPSCAQFTHGELLFCWDPTADDLTDEQIEENRKRFDQALAFFNGAVELVEEAEEVVTDFPAPYAPDCAEICLQHLKAWDEANGSNLLDHFVKAVLEYAGASSAAPVNIPPVGRQQLELVPELGPTVSTSGDSECPVQPGATVTHPKWGQCLVKKVFAPVEGGTWNLALETEDGAHIVSMDAISTVSTSGDSPITKLNDAYPLKDAEVSIRRLQADLAAEKANGGNNQTFALRRFGHPNGQQLSRHIKRLKAEFEIQTGIAA